LFFSARGIGFTGSEEAYQILVNLGQQFLSEIGAGNVTRGIYLFIYLFIYSLILFQTE